MMTRVAMVTKTMMKFLMITSTYPKGPERASKIKLKSNMKVVAKKPKRPQKRRRRRAQKSRLKMLPSKAFQSQKERWQILHLTLRQKRDLYGLYFALGDLNLSLKINLKLTLQRRARKDPKRRQKNVAGING